MENNFLYRSTSPALLISPILMANMLWFYATCLPCHSASTHGWSKLYRSCLTSDKSTVAADDPPHWFEITLGFVILWRASSVEEQDPQLGSYGGKPWGCRSCKRRIATKRRAKQILCAWEKWTRSAFWFWVIGAFFFCAPSWFNSMAVVWFRRSSAVGWRACFFGWWLSVFFSF